MEMKRQRKDVLDGLQGFAPGPWYWVGNDIESDHIGEPVRGVVMESAVQCGAYCQGGMVELDISDADRELIARAPELVEEVKRLRKALERLFPSEEGFTDAFDDLVSYGLLVKVPADDAFRAEWGGDTMYVWRWSPLATEEPDHA